ncbi:MAG TPA: hypothetical protein VJ483_05565 [Holophagaceae bacterium]|nr:hypothetical protein [Holophagaceae bacterium]
MLRRSLLLLLSLALRGQTPAWDYAARLDASASLLTVEARFAPEDADRFTIDDGCAPFVKGLEREEDGRWSELRRDGDGWDLEGAEDSGAHLRWTFDLAGAAKAQRRLSGPRGRDGVWLARPSSFLLRPARYQPDRRARLRMALPEGLVFLSGLHRGADPDSWEASTDDFDDPPYSALGRWRIHRVEVAGGLVEVAEPASGIPMQPSQADAWIHRATGLLATAYGRFPVHRAALILTPTERGRGVLFGTASGHGGAGVIVLLGGSVSESDLDKDWVLTHELIHLAVPDLASAHRWLEEGIPTYLEPLLRLRAGRLDPAAYWSELRSNLPKGQPAAGDEGLDRTPTWGRTYWGGALFCFLADLQIRERSSGHKTLLDALRGIVDSGQTAEQRGHIRDVLRAGDRALGFRVLVPLYERMARAPAPADLEGIWNRLGLGPGSFDDAAPEAGLRRAWGR